MDPRPATERVAVTGPLTVATVARWRSTLLEAFGRGHALAIDLDAAGPCDAAGLQLLLAALTSGPSAVRLERMPEAVRDVAARAGAIGSLEGAAR